MTPDREIRDGVVIIRKNKIVAVGRRGSVDEPPDAEVIDAYQHYIVPGMIDIHVNGAMGADVTKIRPDTFSVMGNFFAQHGVTSYVATAITSPESIFLEVLDHVRGLLKEGQKEGARMLGVHMEGPFLSLGQSGAHPGSLLAQPKPDNYRPFLEYDDVLKIMTLAPELEGAVQLVEELKKRGIVASAGHTDGIYPEMIPAIDAGISLATHIYCNMSHFRRNRLKRVAGAAETLLYDERVAAELIADGWHLGPILMKLVVRIKGVEKVCFVTDAMPATGLPPGKYQIGGVDTIVEEGIARLPDHSAYAGSVTTMDVCIKNGVDQMDLSMKDALQMATLTPARIIGVNNQKGSLEKGKDADVLIMDKDINIHKTIIQGKTEYTRKPDRN
ncbi:MAG: N-acetylglucosamine-6-phosphate deacetylase [Bacteroidales bacterium]|nr:N-acetylglucosamine-6-phosphate deacetylase [Bacteroidales bacterium]